jgi:hypothetical protein
MPGATCSKRIIDSRSRTSIAPLPESFTGSPSSSAQNAACPAESAVVSVSW